MIDGYSSPIPQQLFLMCVNSADTVVLLKSQAKVERHAAYSKSDI